MTLIVVTCLVILAVCAAAFVVLFLTFLFLPLIDSLFEWMEDTTQAIRNRFKRS